MLSGSHIIPVIMGEAHRWEPPKEQDLPTEQEDSALGIDEFIFIFFWAIILPLLLVCVEPAAQIQNVSKKVTISTTLLLIM
jgi:hypothetical protein